MFKGEQFWALEDHGDSAFSEQWQEAVKFV